jgi:photosystem II stability/assembly factor-like uncharacterized protein
MRQLAMLVVMPALLWAALPVQAEDAKSKDPWRALQWREVGPYRGGRAAAVTGIAGNPALFYQGATGGGVWKTQDAGQTWQNISDGFFGGSIGAIDVASSDPNVIYVGTGEGTVRGNMSQGEGAWKSTDAGRTWQAIGLQATRTIARIRVHPQNPDIALAAALGDIFSPSVERGVFKTTDGGKNWRKVLYANDRAGAYDIIFDPSNPRIVYATTWRVTRSPYSLESGGEGSGLWKSVDTGETWTAMTSNEGLPKGVIGVSTIALSAAKPDRLYAMVEAEEGGLFRSEDAGKTWVRINEDRALRQRAWYFSRVYVNPQNADDVFVLNVRFHHSLDGGKTFVQIATPHGDHHDLWIDPNSPQRMIVADDGGAQISLDSGAHWSSVRNQPTAQIYRIGTDNAFPYRLLGGQQDNSAIRIFSRSAEDDAIGERDMDVTAGGESGYIVAKPDDPDIVVGGSYMGFMQLQNHRTHQSRLINVWPEDSVGLAANEVKYRFQWNFPLLFSKHDPNTLWAAGNQLFVSQDLGQSWRSVSPDLTRAEPKTLEKSGGPITKDSTGVEYYATIFALAESSKQKGVLWAGSDDGRLHLTQDGGVSWREVTPPDAPHNIMWNAIEASPFAASAAYVAGTLYKAGDQRPYLYRTKDFGAHWEKIVNGIGPTHFTRVVRSDRDTPGLLYAGTERGLYLSFDDGAAWQRWQLNLPLVPITDLALRDGALIAATQGRGFWMLDDLAPIQQRSKVSNEFYFYAPRVGYRLANDAAEKPVNAGTNSANGMTFFYSLPKSLDSKDMLTLSISDSAGKVMMEFTRKPKPEELKDEKPFFKDDLRLLPAEQGLNRFVWQGAWPAPERFDGLVLWSGDLSHTRAAPGDYVATLKFGSQTLKQNFSLKADPRTSAKNEDYLAQQEFGLKLRDEINALHHAIADLRKLKTQAGALKERTKDNVSLQSDIAALDKRITEVEPLFYQPKTKSEQDPLNFGVALNDKLANVYNQNNAGDFPPTQAMRAVAQALIASSEKALSAFKALQSKELQKLNDNAKAAAIPAVGL